MPQNFDSTLENIESSDAFRNFKKKNPEAYLCAGFFVIDYQTNANQQQLDYSLLDGRIFTFILNHEITIKEAETIQGQEQKNLGKLNPDIKADLDDIENILKDKLELVKIDKKISKIIAILHIYEGRQIWNLTLMLEGFDMIQCHIDSFSGEILKFEHKSMFDFIKKVE